MYTTTKVENITFLFSNNVAVKITIKLASFVQLLLK